MSIKTTLAVCAAVASLYAATAAAQTNQFLVTFRANCVSLNTNGTQLVVKTITDRDIVAQAVGTNTTGSNALGNFALVFDTTADSLQVVNTTNGAEVRNVIDFAGGASTSTGRQRTRLTFMFIPGVSNAIGSAIITDFGTTNTNRANIIGNAQFVETGGVVLGSTNLPVTSTNIVSTNIVSGTGTNLFLTAAFDDPTAQVCTATFFTTTRVPAVTTVSPMVSTATNAVTGTVTNVTTGATTTVSRTRTRTMDP
jgi:hypothetical protein